MSTDALTDLVFLGALPNAGPSEPPTEPTATADVPAEPTPDTPVPPPATTDDKPTLCSKCGRPISQEHVEAVPVEGATEPDYICGECINGVKKEATPADRLLEAVKEAARLRVAAHRFDLKDVETALTDAVEAIVASLETKDVGDWKAYGNLRKTLDAVITQGQQTLEEFTRREYNERVLLAQRIRGMFGMKTSNIDLVAIQQARGKNGGGAPSESSSVIGRISIKPIPADEPCSTPGCKGVVPGRSVANWRGSPEGPRGGWKCKECLVAIGKYKERPPSQETTTA